MKIVFIPFQNNKFANLLTAALGRIRAGFDAHHLVAHVGHAHFVDLGGDLNVVAGGAEESSDKVIAARLVTLLDTIRRTNRLAERSVNQKWIAATPQRKTNWSQIRGWAKY
jgi:hypothetical protein